MRHGLKRGNNSNPKSMKISKLDLKEARELKALLEARLRKEQFGAHTREKMLGTLCRLAARIRLLEGGRV